MDIDAIGRDRWNMQGEDGVGRPALTTWLGALARPHE